jgi:putative transposase
MESPKFFNPRGAIRMSQNRLPHWEQNDATWFLTFRLADSIAADLLRRWTAEKNRWAEQNPEPWTPEQEREFHERFSGAKERWLDAGHGSCLLATEKIRQAVTGALFREHENAVVWSGVIMPNHVHLLVSKTTNDTLSWLLQNWKGGTSRLANKAAGRKDSFWAKDYFDRLIRDSTHFRNCARYIRNNPRKAGLPAGRYTLYECAYVRQLLE